MKKVILITGSTDGIGLETAAKLAQMGHHILLHGRNQEKVLQVQQTLSKLPGEGQIDSYVSDLSLMSETIELAKVVSDKHSKLDVLINNAGVYRSSEFLTKEGLDMRFAVNAVAPYLLTKTLLDLLGNTARVINLSSAAQSRVNFDAIKGETKLSDSAAYAQSKLAITMWSHSMADSLKQQGPIIVAVNPGSMLASKLVKEAYGVIGRDLGIGAEILTRASISDEFGQSASGKYFDNDIGNFALPHPDAQDLHKCKELQSFMDSLLDEIVPFSQSNAD